METIASLLLYVYYYYNGDCNRNRTSALRRCYTDTKVGVERGPSPTLLIDCNETRYDEYESLSLGSHTHSPSLLGTVFVYTIIQSCASMRGSYGDKVTQAHISMLPLHFDLYVLDRGGVRQRQMPQYRVPSFAMAEYGCGFHWRRYRVYSMHVI
mmetsp:Transcript_18937/g.48250  ORF Transcript_18937/g.48250 Transcript_18937/m.48250 type:complete len:154 (-) Transcript_18937:3161-3622(-)